MPGTPPTAPRTGAPRYADSDTAAFSSQVNAITDAFDAFLTAMAPRPTVQSAAYAASAGDFVVMTGAFPVTLPHPTVAGAKVVVYAPSNAVAVTPSSTGSDGIATYEGSTVTTFIVPAGSSVEFTYDPTNATWYLRGGGRPPIVSALPASPNDGDEVYFEADPTNGVVWHLRYRAASSSTHKWEFVGGASLDSYVATAQGPGSGGSWQNLGTTGPEVTVPLAGDYEVEARADVVGTPNSAFIWEIGLTNNGISSPAPSIAIAQYAGPSAGGSTVAAVLSILDRAVGLAAGDQLSLLYQVVVGTCTFGNRGLRVTPVRVG